LEPLARHAENTIVFAQRRYVARRHALELQPQDVEGVGPLDRLLDAREHCHTHLVDRVGHERARTAYSDLRTQLAQSLDSLEVIAKREQVEQPLRQMLVRPIARAARPAHASRSLQANRGTARL